MNWDTIEWLPISEAPKDGRLLLLAVEAPEDHNDDDRLEDTGGLSRTIGMNNFDADGEDVWQFVGWDWDNNEFLHGRGGQPILFAEFPALAGVSVPPNEKDQAT